ncbi:probable E3 ubiquitin-protein ligase RHB1A [Solanum pennellii]|uniref:RING-type E3 ubiquitin transferase n=1 Tax=Solanum pennellii TaxID=28526 RepID=A0ABM1GDI2_SOLPN|nr:probable E3 ubiquitin-protein ligase RHB1A [Solanum pennellii]XP_015069584.1 probable E3 ubiquitin-protein ligase RHB1A [Solanum pennellii]XP_015069592.1 probable E3 ubiquitin-protein ligase RHB1A [Solanum pennellii]
MSATEATLPTAGNRRSYRCYNCNDAFHITTTVGVSSSFRCPRCFHRHLLPNYTIASFIPFPQHLTLTDYTLSISESITFNYSDSDTESDESDSDDLSFELFNPPQFRSPTLQSFLNSLPSVKINESSKNCSICMEEFGIDTEASQLPCKHFFHNDCIIPWLNRSNTCPLCRYKLPQEDEGEDEDEIEVILDGEIGGIEFQENFTASTLTEVGDDDDLRERDLDAMRDEDGDIMMVDA